MLRFKESILIQQPVGRVFRFATDLYNNTQWQTNVLEVEQTSNGPFGKGATFRCVNEFMGSRIETEVVVVDYDPEKKFSFRLTSGPVAGESSFLFETVEEGTCFTTAGELDLGMFRIGGWFIRRAANRQIKDDLKRLKEILENGNGSRRSKTR